MKAMTEDNSTIKFKAPIDSSVSNQNGEFQRIEDKYLLPSTLKNLVLEKLYKNMEPSYLHKDTTFTLIESIYFDSAQFEFFFHHFLPVETRYKMRIRRYAPNGIWSEGPVLLELKRKRNGESKKSRFMLPLADLEKIKRLQTLNFNNEIREINPTMKMKTLLKRIHKVNDLISTYSLLPVLSIQYNRLAFEKDGFRVTLDQELSGKGISGMNSSHIASLQDNPEIWQKASLLFNKFENDDQVVMEIKHQGVIPNWMTELLNELKLEKTNFSKYCWFAMNESKNMLFPMANNKFDKVALI